MKYTKYPELKSELKQLAKDIRKWKNNRKMDRMIELDMFQHEIQAEVGWRKHEFRHKHIAYCILRGRKYEQIENFCKVAPNFDRIDKIKAKYEQEALRISA